MYSSVDLNSEKKQTTPICKTGALMHQLGTEFDPQKRIAGCI